MSHKPKTENKQIRDSRVLLNNMLDSIAEGIYCVDMQGKCTYCNSSCLDLLRFDRRSELLGRNMHELIHHSLRDGSPYEIVNCQIFKAYSAGKNIHVDDEVFFRKDGSRFDAEYWSYPLKKDGTIVGAVISFIDITLKREEQAYRSQLAQLVESSYDAIISKDLNGVIRSWNHGAEKIYGYDAEEAIGQDISLLLLSGQIEEPEIIEAVRNGTQLKQFETKRKRKNGDICDISLTVSPIFNSDDVLTGTSTIERDITANRQAQDEILAAKMVAEQAESIANKASRSRAEFLANVSHELRTPMNGILGMLQLSLEEPLDPIVADYLKTAKSSADAMLALVNEILDFSKIESGSFEIENEAFNLRELVDSTAKTLSPRASEKGLEILCEIDSKIPKILIGDGRRIQQVLTNILGNAIKFTEVGEIVIKVSQIRRLPNETRLRFSVMDTGIGIGLADRKRIFAPFAQADMSSTRKHHGTGLGLSICKQLISLMGGRLKLKSEIGKGSKFFFELSLPISAESQHVDVIPFSLARNLRVLVVDDNPTNLRILEKILVSWSMQPIVAENAEQALQILNSATSEEHEISLAIIDGMMPEVDGFELAENVAEKLGVGNPPVVIMQSAADLALFSDKKKNAPVANYLNKPVSESELLNTVIETLDLYNEDAGSGSISNAYPGSTRALNILLVEDLPANQKVATAILEKRGHNITAVPNGRVAIETVQNNGDDIDLILMDIQMPVMDGFQATAAIRSMPEDSKAQIPIVAMTAHAMHGDKESCLEAGMDAYIAKPLDAIQLVEVVESIVFSSDPTTFQNENGVDSGSDEIPFRIPLVAFDVVLRRLGGDRELLQEFVAIFNEDSPELVDKIKHSIEIEDSLLLEKSAHALKGLMSNFVATPCVELAQQFENAGKNNSIQSVKGELDRFTELYRLLCDELTTLPG